MASVRMRRSITLSGFSLQFQHPEADVVMMNPAHRDAARVPPLVTRPFSFAECLNTSPMRARYKSEG